jgi:phosphoribosylanthranilate isomerase
MKSMDENRSRMGISMKVKICGITNYKDAALALDLGADRIGFVMAPSPRRMESEAVRSIVSRLRDEGRLEGRGTVGVFADERPSEIARILSFATLDEAQLEGGESPEECALLPFPWYKKIKVDSVEDAESRVAAGWTCGRILIDAAYSSAAGAGKTFGVWATLAARDIARGLGKEVVLAGGIGARNVASVVHSLAPDGIDLCSSVEDAPGRMSREKLERLFGELRRAVGDSGRAIA